MSSSKAARGGIWARFFVSEATALLDVPLGGRVDRYRVDDVRHQAGAPVTGVEVGMTLVRVEAPGPDPHPAPGARFHVTGVVQHLTYTDVARRIELAAVSAGERGPHAVLIPIAKSDAWWALAQDERDRFFRRTADRPGHVEIGLRHASVIFRRLYHARYQPGSEWDFLTYFEFPDEEIGRFRHMLAELRDPLLNPEWRFVERETEIWMTKR
jgi:hypothetical protein